MEVYCNRSPEADSKECAFNWTLSIKDEKEFFFEFEFQNKTMVSQTSQPDQLLINIWGAPSLKDKMGNLMFTEPLFLQYDIPLLLQGNKLE